MKKTLSLILLMVFCFCSVACAESPKYHDIGQFRISFPADFYDVSEAFDMDIYANEAGSYFCPVYQEGNFEEFLTGSEEEIFQRIQDKLIVPTAKSCVRLTAEYSGGCYKVACVTVGDHIGYTIAVLTNDGLLIGISDKETLELMYFWVKTIFTIK